MNSIITEIFNNLFVVSAIFGFYYSIRWQLLGLNETHRLIVRGWQLVFVAVAIRIGFWSAALKFANPFEIYHPWFIEWKWVMTATTSLIFAVGMLMFIETLSGASKTTQCILLLLAIAISVLAAAI